MRCTYIFLTALLTASSAQANDTMAELAAGGIQYVKSDAVEMVEERLYVSLDKVTVDYVFENKSDNDVETLVAFPMPDIEPSPDSDIAISDTESDNFLGFVVTQDGKPIDVMLQQRALILNLDVTDQLVAAGIPLANYSEKTVAALEKNDPQKLAELAARGIISLQEWDDGSGMKQHAVAMWTLKSTYYWTTKYAAKSKVSVSHTYKTGTGGTTGLTFIGDNGKAGGEQLDRYRTRYCVDSQFVSSVERKMKSSTNENGVDFVENWFSYILSTGANWSGPIGKFTLIVDKGAPENLVSFCGEGVTKTGPTTFEMTKTDFWPEQDLHVLVLRAVR
jgi:Domain of unknown function (DUF4424)